METPSKFPKIAWIVAFVLAGITAIGAIMETALAILPALIPVCAGIGILRRRIWSARGYGIFLSAQSVFATFLLFRQRNPAGIPATGGTAVFSLLLAILFLFAGRALAREGAARGRAWPWIVASVLCTVPFLFVEPFFIPTGAMENTILVGDRSASDVCEARDRNWGRSHQSFA